MEYSEKDINKWKKSWNYLAKRFNSPTLSEDMDNFLKQEKIDPERLKYLDDFVKATKKYYENCEDILYKSPNPIYVGFLAEYFFSGYDKDLGTFLKDKEIKNTIPKTWEKYKGNFNIKDAPEDMGLLSYFLNYPAYTTEMKNTIEKKAKDNYRFTKIISALAYPTAVAVALGTPLGESPLAMLLFSGISGIGFLYSLINTKNSYKPVSKKPIPKWKVQIPIITNRIPEFRVTSFNQK